MIGVFKISYRYRKYLWLAIGIAGAFGVYLLIVAPLRGLYDTTREQMEMAQVKLERSERLVEQRTGLDREIRLLDTMIEKLQNSMFEGETTSLVGAKMQEIMDGICRKNGADIRQTRVLEVKDAGLYKEISISVDMVSSLAGLARIIYELNNNSFLFTIPDINARTTGVPNDVNVRTRMTVVGLMNEKKTK
jgi:hypothetical protein